MKEKHKIRIRVSVFAALVVLMIGFLNAFFQPVWFEWNNFYSQKGFYEEPDDTIETLFIGASTMLNAVNPTQLYEDYGICAYNLASEQQPMLASYYWIQEVMRFHENSLKTVVLEVSELRDASGIAVYHKAFDNMKFSFVKLRALAAYQVYSGKAFQLFSLYSYHTRWSELTETDFEKFSLDATNGTRGYNFNPKAYGLTKSFSFVKDIVLDEDAEPKELVKSSLLYFEQIVNYCEKKGLNLVLVKVPTKNWSSELHNAVGELAEQYSLEFFDFNFAPLYDELGFVDLFDCSDTIHLNYYGSVKITDWIGKFLVEELDASDVRDNPDYAFMDEQLTMFNNTYKLIATLRQTTNVAEYLTEAIKEHTSVLISVKDTANKKLTDEQREVFSQLGLEKLSELGYRESYLALVQNGEVVSEKLQECDPDIDEILSYSGNLPNGVSFSIESGGYKNGNVASVLIDGEEQAKNTRGINIVVYNNLTGEVLDSVVFDSYKESEREVYKLEYASLINDEDALSELEENSVFQKMLARIEKIENLRQENTKEKNENEANSQNSQTKQK